MSAADSVAPARRPHQPITDDLILRVDAALDATQGHRGHAAKLLGVETKRFDNIVYNTPALKAKWGKHAREVPQADVAGDFHRDTGVVPPFTPEELRLADAFSSQCEVWESGMAKLGFTAEKRDFLEAVQTTHGSHWGQISQMFRGGVSYTATELLFQFNKLMEQIKDTYENPDKYERKMENQWGPYVTKTAHEVRLELMDRALSIAEMFRKLNSDSERAELIAAQIEKLKVEQAEDVKKRKKAGWSAKNVTPLDGP